MGPTGFSASPFLQALSTVKGGALSMLLAQQISCSCLFDRDVIEILAYIHLSYPGKTALGQGRGEMFAV